ncbi:NAD(P)-dependent oxidoreductase [Adhaeribacter soli]|uniref:SDR family oxidoreductase n=1 Tax=Adhaeribacter soli TaxID=2607655 RepID=A0A5N1IXJ3_9BACT|nr:SDR family oxidoreductase [Adhaeribacter soli]KAA9339004.1 SDR family oxidoreductase [Adhaeribacter soli]
MKLIVFGASGRTGQEIVQQALAGQHTVTAFVRNTGSFNLKHERLNVVQGDITAYQEVENAIAGHDAVLSALGPRTLKTRIPALVSGIKNIVSAMESTGVRRLVYESALGVGDSEADQNLVFRYFILPVLLARDYSDHAANEKTIRSSNLDWVIVRPARLVDGPQTGKYEVGLKLSATFPFGKVTRADVAEFMLRQLTDNA